ncbi:hypothetical protein TWF694_008983 [Orbilia ellipsospora]|uniref:Uncharacterized protein n=1 Tax=Orbilia ellipsospora TaxID=2528407 RepID=A0AAV9XEY4_9PEZI
MGPTYKTVGLLYFTILSTLVDAYEIAFTSDEVETEGYQYHYGFPMISGMEPTCNSIPLEYNPLEGADEVLVRAKTGTPPVPRFIGLYNKDSPNLGKCNHKSLEQIIAFNPLIFDKQQMAQVWTTRLHYWKEIVYNPATPNKDLASTLITEFHLVPGRFLYKSRQDLEWILEKRDLATYDWNENPFTRDPNGTPEPDQMESELRLRNEGKTDTWMNDIQFAKGQGYLRKEGYNSQTGSPLNPRKPSWEDIPSAPNYGDQDLALSPIVPPNFADLEAEIKYELDILGEVPVHPRDENGLLVALDGFPDIPDDLPDFSTLLPDLN